jgi:hypothetical protein
MSNFTLLDVANVNASYGRGVVFYSPKWSPNEGSFQMNQLGVTEGDIVITPQEGVAGLTLPELTGPAIHEMDYLGENPKVDIPLYVADPSLMAILSPSGSKDAGRSRRGPVKEYTLFVIPEAIFLTDDAVGIVSTHVLAFDPMGAWTIDGQPLTAAQEALLGVSFWLWRAFFNRPVRKFRGGAGDAKKNIEVVSLAAMHHPDMPEGQHIYTTGDPFASGIDLNGFS